MKRDEDGVILGCNFDQDALHGAMVDDPSDVPAGALMVVRFRPSFELRPRPVAVDARRLLGPRASAAS